jgi:hypothetical protein
MINDKVLKGLSVLITIGLIFSCNQAKHSKISHRSVIFHDTIIRDCNYSFEEAISGSKAPDYILNQLQLIEVKYISFDRKTHLGQLLVNKTIAIELKQIFEIMYKQRFPIAHVIPIVKYNWDDYKSMQSNNTYCFCYRDVYYSKHALGLAVDINPYLNPVRYKPPYGYRPALPIGAQYNPEALGTFTMHSEIVLKFKELGFLWGHYFKHKYDDHHFEKK